MVEVNIVFRVDASIKIGTGHVMRCLTLANDLRANGIVCYFICRAHIGHMSEKIKADGHNILLLPLLHKTDVEIKANQKNDSSLFDETLIEDANETIQYIKKINARWLVVDHLNINAVWEEQIKNEINIKIMVIDGLANRKHNCDMLLDQTYTSQGEKRWKNFVPEKCKLFIGPQFALLRAEFIEAHKKLRQRNGKVKRILISFGGIDEPNATSMSIDAFSELNKDDVIIDVIIGAANPHRKNLIEKYNETNNINIHISPNDIADLMVAADLAIGGGGTMMWERCLLKLPTLIISIAENQINLAKELHLITAAVYIGDSKTVTCKSIKASINKLMNNEEKIIEIQRVNEKLMSKNNSSVTKYLIENS